MAEGRRIDPKAEKDPIGRATRGKWEIPTKKLRQEKKKKGWKEKNAGGTDGRWGADQQRK